MFAENLMCELLHNKAHPDSIPGIKTKDLYRIHLILDRYKPEDKRRAEVFRKLIPPDQL